MKTPINNAAAIGKKGWPAQTELAWPILGVRHFSDINRGLLLEAGASLNLAKATAQRLLVNISATAPCRRLKG